MRFTSFSALRQHFDHVLPFSKTPTAAIQSLKQGLKHRTLIVKSLIPSAQKVFPQSYPAGALVNIVI
jgi:hypothetical protein